MLAARTISQRIPKMILALLGSAADVEVVEREEEEEEEGEEEVAITTATARPAECMFFKVTIEFMAPVTNRSAPVHSDTDKQVSQGWGANKGASEWDDERAGEDLAHKDGAGVELQDPNALPVSETPIAEGETAEVVPKPEPEEILKTYDEYLTELAQRQADLGPPVEVRRPNEGGSNKKWATAKELSRKEEEEGDYFVGESKDKTRNRERKIKQVLDIEPQFAEPREARGGMRGGRERGGGGGGGNSGKEPRNKHKNSDRAPRGGDYRGQQSGGAVNIADSSAFPSLGK